MRRLPIILISITFFLFAFKPVFAIQKFGPHIGDIVNPSFISNLRNLYNQAGSTGEVPLMVLIEPGKSTAEVSSFLDSCKENNFWPILRLYKRDGEKITDGDVTTFSDLLASVNNKAGEFSGGYLYVEFGNEVNYGAVEWSNSEPQPEIYSQLLDKFIDEIRQRASNFKVGNAALNTSLTDKNLNMSPITYWDNMSPDTKNKLDVLFFNPYHLGDSPVSNTIDGWKEELSAIGDTGKPKVFSEFGYKPDESIDDRKSWIAQRYSNFINNKSDEYINSVEEAEFVTPLLHIPAEKTIAVPIFGADGTVSWTNAQASGLSESPSGQGDNKENKGKTTTNKIEDYVFSYKPYPLEYKTADNNTLKENSSDGSNNSSSQEDDDEIKKSSYYVWSNSFKGPTSVSTDANKYFLGIPYINSAIDIGKRIFGVKTEGEKQAKKFAQQILPYDKTEQALINIKDQAYNQDTSNKNVLGWFSDLFTIDPMDEVWNFRECAGLPYNICKGEYSKPEVDNNPVVSPDVSPPETIPGSGEGVCTIPDSGPCSLDALAEDFPDINIRKKASQICFRESGGDEDVVNKGCLSGKSLDYSVGLFQINLLPSNRCPGAFSSYTADPPSCTIKDEDILKECVERLSKPEENIKEALRISNNGQNWCAWGAAQSKYCAICIKKPW